MTDRTRFTLVFDCETDRCRQNPFHVDTPYGRPVAMARGDAIDEWDRCRDELEAGPSIWHFWGGVGGGAAMTSLLLPTLTGTITQAVIGFGVMGLSIWMKDEGL